MSERAEMEMLTLCAACDQHGFEAAKAHVTEDMFSIADHRTAWRVIESAYKAGSHGIDYAQLLDGMKDAGVKPITDWIERIVKASYEASYASYHAKRLLACHRADRMRAIAEQVTSLQMMTDDRLKWIQQEIQDISGGIEREALSLAEVLAIPDIERRVVKTGFPMLDGRLNGGIRAKELIVAGGRPGAGKTTLMMQIALQAAYQYGTRCLIVTIEMSAGELAKRMMRKVDAGRLAELPIFVRDDLTDWRQMESAIKQTIRSKHIDLVVVDYIQRITHSGADYRERQIAEISGGLKDIAREADIPVIAGSQLNRESVRKGTRPTLSDLRESGAIEQDADVVLLLGQSEEHQAMRTFDIAKQRNGATGKHELRLDGPNFWFEEVAEADKFADVASAWD